MYSSCSYCVCCYFFFCLCFFFFFFQAEDGIRDDLVTGVQTCALPISLPQREMVSIKGRALPQQEMVSINGGGAAATRNGQYKKRGRSRKDRKSVV